MIKAAPFLLWSSLAPARGVAVPRSPVSLSSRVGLVLLAVLLAALAAGTAWWVGETRRAIKEEVNAASQVAQQWVVVLVSETLRDSDEGQVRLMEHLRAVGRLRANRLEVVGADGRLLHVSPESTYKAGRFAPVWFSDWVEPTLQVRRFDAGDRTILLRPDASRSVLDAWDDLRAGLSTLLLVLIAGVAASRWAVRRALAPLAEIDRALARGTEGRFDQRLPNYRVAELDRVASTFNRLAAALEQSRDLNLRLEEDQAFAGAVQARLEEERRLIARELHDELGQGITAVRAISGAILQRSADQPQIHGSAQAILAMTSQMQDGVRAILQRLRPTIGEGGGLDRAVTEYCRLWSEIHPSIAIECAVCGSVATSGRLGITVLRLLQESLTNVARHAGATRVDVRVAMRGSELELDVCDNGCGLAPQAEEGFGLRGMRERVAELRGEFRIETAPAGGLHIAVRLPVLLDHEENEHGCHA
ncbi:sensor histidine kinase [Aromatoleum evansii]|uniref:histidine kinase n=1 Tax=Aromatoleum evansii TaxID=59406 RepID=A0ABZ1AG65_AROEV|nr:sensor histidine kinase [Aromatoleum evansii]